MSLTQDVHLYNWEHYVYIILPPSFLLFQRLITHRGRFLTADALLAFIYLIRGPHTLCFVERKQRAYLKSLLSDPITTVNLITTYSEISYFRMTQNLHFLRLCQQVLPLIHQEYPIA